MFRQMRRQDRQISTEEAIAALKQAEHGVLSTVGSDGYPYGVPLSYVYAGNRILFHCAAEGAKLDAIARDNRVCFTVVSDAEVVPQDYSVNYTSVVVFGRAVELTGQDKEDAMLTLVGGLAASATGDPREAIARAGQAVRVYAIEIDHMSGKARH